MNAQKKDPSVFYGLKTLINILETSHKKKFFFITLFAIIVGLFEVLTALFVMIYSEILYDPSSGMEKFKILKIFNINVSDNNLIFIASISLGIIFFTKNIFAIIEVFYHNFTIQKICYTFKNKLLNYYLHTNYDFHLKRNSATSVEVLSFNVENTFTGGLIACANVLIEVIILILLLIIIISINPQIAIIIISISACVGFILQKLFLPKFYFWGKDLLGTFDSIQKFLVEIFNCLPEVNIFQKQNYFMTIFSNHTKKMARSRAIITATNSIPRFLVEILFVGIFIFSIFYLSSKTSNFNEVVGLLGAYLYAGFRIMPGLNRIVNQVNMFKSTIPSIQRIHDELKQIQSDEIIEEKNEFIFKNSIKFNNVYFNYGDRKKNVLKNVNFEIFKGDNVGIIGQTGSGKSTLINLISGLINPSSGKLLIDEKIPANSIMWKKKVAYVSQNIFLLDNTIETNIAFGDQNIDYEKMNRVCRYAQLETTIKKLKKGLRTRVGEHGKELSGGEIQRIAIARALYLGREVFIFDEATSALDKKTEESFIDIIKGELKNFTLIIISHKLGSLKFCNKIFKIDDGRIEKFKN